jgi:hypothetical protein
MTKILVPVLALAALAGIMRADVPVCAQGTIASVLALGTCTIGNETFTFTGYDPETLGAGINSDNSAALVGFTPLTTSGSAPGFRLAATFSSAETSNLPKNSSTAGYGYLYFDVATTNHDSRITGIETTMEGLALTTTPDGSCSEGSCYAVAAAYTYSYLTTLGTVSYVEPVQSQGSGQLPSSHVRSYTSPFVTPSAQASGFAFFQTYAETYNGTGSSSASATFTSADYLIMEIAAVPEPSSIVLLVVMIGLVALKLQLRVHKGKHAA